MRLTLAALALLMALPSTAVRAQTQANMTNPGPSVPTPTGSLQGIASFVWNGTAWVPGGGGSGGSGSNPTVVSQAPSALNNSAANTMGTTATIIVPASATRKWLMITNRTAGSETQDIGSSNVTVGGGIPLAPGGGFLFNGVGASGPLYGITTVAGSPFSYVEG